SLTDGPTTNRDLPDLKKGQCSAYVVTVTVVTWIRITGLVGLKSNYPFHVNTFVRLCAVRLRSDLHPWITRSDPVDSSTIAACNGELDKELDFASLRMLEIPPPSSLPPCQVVTRKTKETIRCLDCSY